MENRQCYSKGERKEVYMKGIDASYHYEGYYAFKSEEL